MKDICGIKILRKKNDGIKITNDILKLAKASIGQPAITQISSTIFIASQRQFINNQIYPPALSIDIKSLNIDAVMVENKISSIKIGDEINKQYMKIKCFVSDGKHMVAYHPLMLKDEYNWMVDSLIEIEKENKIFAKLGLGNKINTDLWKKENIRELSNQIANARDKLELKEKESNIQELRTENKITVKEYNYALFLLHKILTYNSNEQFHTISHRLFLEKAWGLINHGKNNRLLLVVDSTADLKEIINLFHQDQKTQANILKNPSATPYMVITPKHGGMFDNHEILLYPTLLTTENNIKDIFSKNDAERHNADVMSDTNEQTVSNNPKNSCEFSGVFLAATQYLHTAYNKFINLAESKDLTSILRDEIIDEIKSILEHIEELLEYELTHPKTNSREFKAYKQYKRFIGNSISASKLLELSFLHKEIYSERFFFMRHGYTSWNNSDILKGPIDPCLTTKEEIEKIDVNKHIKMGNCSLKTGEEGIYNILDRAPYLMQVTKIFHDNTIRAYQTAKIVQEHLNRYMNDRLEIQKNIDMATRSYGDIRYTAIHNYFSSCINKNTISMQRLQARSTDQIRKYQDAIPGFDTSEAYNKKVNSLFESNLYSFIKQNDSTLYVGQCSWVVELSKQHAFSEIKNAEVDCGCPLLWYKWDDDKFIVLDVRNMELHKSFYFQQNNIEKHLTLFKLDDKSKDVGNQLLKIHNVFLEHLPKEKIPSPTPPMFINNLSFTGLRNIKQPINPSLMQLKEHYFNLKLPSLTLEKEKYKTSFLTLELYFGLARKSIKQCDVNIKTVRFHDRLEIPFWFTYEHALAIQRGVPFDKIRYAPPHIALGLSLGVTREEIFEYNLKREHLYLILSGKKNLNEIKSSCTTHTSIHNSYENIKLEFKEEYGVELLETTLNESEWKTVKVRYNLKDEHLDLFNLGCHKESMYVLLNKINAMKDEAKNNLISEIISNYKGRFLSTKNEENKHYLKTDDSDLYVVKVIKKFTIDNYRGYSDQYIIHFIHLSRALFSSIKNANNKKEALISEKINSIAKTVYFSFFQDCMLHVMLNELHVCAQENRDEQQKRILESDIYSKLFHNQLYKSEIMLQLIFSNIFIGLRKGDNCKIRKILKSNFFQHVYSKPYYKVKIRGFYNRMLQKFHYSLKNDILEIFIRNRELDINSDLCLFSKSYRFSNYKVMELLILRWQQNGINILDQKWMDKLELLTSSTRVVENIALSPTILNLAIAQNNLQMVKFLKKHGVIISKNDLLSSLIQGDLDIIDSLISGLDMNISATIKSIIQKFRFKHHKELKLDKHVILHLLLRNVLDFEDSKSLLKQKTNIKHANKPLVGNISIYDIRAANRCMFNDVSVKETLREAVKERYIPIKQLVEFFPDNLDILANVLEEGRMLSLEELSEATQQEIVINLLKKANRLRKKNKSNCHLLGILKRLIEIGLDPNISLPCKIKLKPEMKLDLKNKPKEEQWIIQGLTRKLPYVDTKFKTYSKEKTEQLLKNIGASDCNIAGNLLRKQKTLIDKVNRLGLHTFARQFVTPSVRLSPRARL